MRHAGTEKPPVFKSIFKKWLRMTQIIKSNPWDSQTPRVAEEEQLIYSQTKRGKPVLLLSVGWAGKVMQHPSLPLLREVWQMREAQSALKQPSTAQRGGLGGGRGGPPARPTEGNEKDGTSALKADVAMETEIGALCRWQKPERAFVVRR